MIKNVLISRMNNDFQPKYSRYWKMSLDKELFLKVFFSLTKNNKEKSSRRRKKKRGKQQKKEGKMCFE